MMSPRIGAALLLLVLVVTGFAQDEPKWEPGITVRMYRVGEGMSLIPALMPGQTPNVDRLCKKLDLSETRGDFGELKDYFFVLAKARLRVPSAGRYAFRLTSDDGSALWLDGDKVLDHDGLHGPSALETDLALEARTYELEVHHFENAGGADLKLEWKRPGESEFSLLTDEFLSTPKGVVRVTSPGKKKIGRHVAGRAGGDGRPLEGVHPSYDLATVRPEVFKPKVGGIDFLADGRMVVCCWEPMGGVYVLDGVHGDPSAVTVKQIARGLAEPLGLKVVGDRLFVLQKQELTELIDRDGDGVIDEYRCLCDDWAVTPNFHEFAFGLVEKDGWLYFNLAIAINPGGASTNPQAENRGRTARVKIETGEIEFLTHGLRTPNGIGLAPDGEIYITDNQGDWLPSSKVLRLEKGAFYEQRAALPRGWKEKPSTPPVVWMPQNDIGNSPGEPSFFTTGPFAGQMAVCDVTHGGVKRVFIERVGDVAQGALFRFTQGLEAGINRMKFREDGTLFVGGIGSTGNWGHEGGKWYGLQRLRPNGAPTFEILAVRAHANGFEIEMTVPLGEGHGGDASRYQVRSFHYEPTKEYGGPKKDLAKVAVARASVSGDHRRVLLELEGPLVAGKVYHLRLPPELRSANRLAPWAAEAWYTLNAVPPSKHDGFANTPAGPPLNSLSAAEEAEGWTLLFDGESPTGFRGFRKDTIPGGWKVEDGLLRTVPGQAQGDLLTKESYEDFEFQCEWRVVPAGNSGLMYLVTEEGNWPWATGPEMQVLDDNLHPDGGNPATSAGACYALYPCKRPAVRPADQWNHARIKIVGGKVEHWLNGVNVVTYDIRSDEFRQRVAKSKFRDMLLFGKAKKGHVAIQHHGEEVHYRNIKVRRLR